jgi:endonuclease/exonuclease/phosphatase family metal-dependent hydrolase
MRTESRVRIATYNVHKCRGMDQRVDPLRIAAIIEELDADIVAVQEIMDVEDGTPAHDQARTILSRLRGYEAQFGETRRILGGPYGNMTLSRWPVAFWRNYDITWRNRERRGCLRTDVQLPGGEALHLFNVHLGTGWTERRHQSRELVSRRVLTEEGLVGPRVVVGDFNEWTRGLASRLMSGFFDSVDLRLHLRYARTYPALVPVLHLDHFYFDRHLKLEGFKVHRSRTALLASDHLPLVAEFTVRSVANMDV